MALADKVRITLEKLQGLPEETKKIILWTIVVILALIMGIFWINGALNSIQQASQDVGNIQLPTIETPSIKMPDLEENKTPEK
jgi:hypothetical protein